MGGAWEEEGFGSVRERGEGFGSERERGGGVWDLEKGRKEGGVRRKGKWNERRIRSCLTYIPILKSFLGSDFGSCEHT